MELSIMSIMCIIFYSENVGPSNRQGNLPFDASKVIEQVSRNRHFCDARQGEFLVDTNVVYGPAATYPRFPAVAFDGINYLVVWLDTRLGFNYGILGVRVDQSGTVLDTAGILISTTLSYKYFPAVAYGGSVFLVSWDEFRVTPDERDIYAARVDCDGVVLDPDGIVISDAYDWQCDPEIAFDGTNFFVTWADFRNDFYNTDLYGARVSTAGNVLDPQGIPISLAVGTQGDHTIVFDGTNYFLAWYDERNWGTAQGDVYCTWVSPSGTVLDTTGIAIAWGARQETVPAAAFDGNNYLVVWKENIISLEDNICGRRVSQSGVVLDSTAILFDSTAEHWLFPAVCFGDTNYLVVWQREGSGTMFDVYGRRVSPAGVVLDSTPLVISAETGLQVEARTAFDGTNFFVVWADGRTETLFGVCGSRVSQSGMALDPHGILLSTGANHQSSAAIVYDGMNYLAVWQDYRGGSCDICGTRVDPSGTILDPLGIIISAAAGNQVAPDIAYDGINYFVVWEDFRADTISSNDANIYAARISTSGVVLEPDGIPISTAPLNQRMPALTLGQPGLFIVWSDWRNAATRTDIYGARITLDGAVIDTNGINISSAVKSQLEPDVVYNGTEYLVAWTDYRNDPGNHTNYDIYAARVDQAGVVLDPSGITVSNAVLRQEGPSTAFDGIDYFVAWSDLRNDPSQWTYYYDIYGARVSQTGIVLDSAGIVVSNAERSQEHPAIVYDGTDYFVVWDDTRNEGTQDIYGAKVSISGAVVDSFIVSMQGGAQNGPALTCGAGDQILVAYSGWTDSINGHVTNTMRTWGKFYPFVGIEDNAALRVQETMVRLQSYPSLIRKECNLEYVLPKKAKVNLSMYDATGRLVKTLTDETQNAGVYHKTFNANGFPQGVYFIRLEIPGNSIIKKVIFIK